MDPIRNPYAPGAGQRPPELAGRDEQLDAFDVVLERVARGRPERSIVLTGLRGVGKTVLLNALRSAAVRAGWGTGKLEARPDQSLRRPLASAVHQAVRELGAGRWGGRPRARGGQGVRPARAGRRVRAWGRASCATAGTPASRVPAVTGRADSGDIEIDLVELLSDLGGTAADTGRGIAVFIDEMQDLGPDDVSALCAACHEISQSRLPVIVVGAGLPHLPAVLSASKSYSERLFRYSRIDRLDRAAADAALALPAEDEGAGVHRRGTRGDVRRDRRVPLLHPGVRQGGLGPRAGIPDDRATTSRWRRPEAESELAVGFFGSRFERATPGEREYLRAMADVAVELGDETDAVPTADVAAHLGRKPQSLSPARDALLKKGLIYSGERGRIAFTVPHFGRYLREHA